MDYNKYMEYVRNSYSGNSDSSPNPMNQPNYDVVDSLTPDVVSAISSGAKGRAVKKPGGYLLANGMFVTESVFDDLVNLGLVDTRERAIKRALKMPENMAYTPSMVMLKNSPWGR